MKISIQNWIVCSKSDKEQVELIATAGFKYVDWDMARFKGSSKQGKESDEETVKYYENLRNICDANGLTVCMSHAIYPTYSEKNQADVLKRIEKCFIASNILGSKYMVVHPFMPKKWEGEQNRELRVSKNIKFYNSLTTLAERYDVTICIENMFGFPNKSGYNETACSRYEEMLDIYNGIKNKKWFAFCYDSGHANMLYKDKQTDMINALGENIKTVHLHDNNGKIDFHRLPHNKGTINWDDTILSLKNAGFNGVYNFEISPNELRGLIKKRKLARVYEYLVEFANKYEKE